MIREVLNFLSKKLFSNSEIKEVDEDEENQDLKEDKINQDYLCNNFSHYTTEAKKTKLWTMDGHFKSNA